MYQHYFLFEGKAKSGAVALYNRAQKLAMYKALKIYGARQETNANLNVSNSNKQKLTTRIGHDKT